MATNGGRGTSEGTTHNIGDGETRGNAEGMAPDAGRHETLREILRGVRAILESMPQDLPGDDGPTVAEVVSEHLGVPADSLSVVLEEVAPHRYVDFDNALTHLVARDPDARLVGVGGGDTKHHQSLAGMIGDRGFDRSSPPIGQADYQNMAVGPDQERSIVSFGLHLFRAGDCPIAVLQRTGRTPFGGGSPTLEVLAPDARVVQDLLVELRRLALELSALRNQVVSLSGSGFESSAEGVTFIRRPELRAQDVILPTGVLDRIEQHVLGIAERRETLRRYGQHLKRGVLLYGPPGTGKTHTVRYLLGATPTHTVILLTGETLRYVSLATQIARALQPAIVVLEDCDLVAEDRDMSFGATPLLFEVLDAMDGLSDDADVTFLLTTNRVEAMERALTQRPGRVDLAVEIPLPDEAGRRRLLDLYSPPGTFGEAAIEEVARRTEGSTASFTKELVRRAELAAALRDAAPGDDDLVAATDRLLSDQEALSRRLLGNGGLDGTPDEPPDEAGMPDGFVARPGMPPWIPDLR